MTPKILVRFLPVLYIFLFHTISFSQEVVLLNGEILTDSLSAENIHIVNLTIEKGTTSDQYGRFQIYAKPQDSILFSSVQFQNRIIVIREDHITSGSIEIHLYPANNELDEVQIDNIKLSGYLGSDLSRIKYFDREKYGIPYPEKKLSQTERRLYTANAGITSRWQYIGVLLGGVPLDVVLNDINGRTKYLKKLDKQDKLQIRVKEAIEFFGKGFFMEEFELPETEVENFVYFCAGDPEFEIIFRSENKLDQIEFYKNKIEDFINLRELNESSEN